MKLLEQIDGKRVQITCLKEERIDLKAIEAISQMEIDELMTIQVDDNVVYSCLNFISLSKRLENPISRFDFHMIIAQIAQMHRIAKHMEWHSTDVVWNPDYIYMSPTTREVKFMYLPHNDIPSNSITLMLERIIYSATQINPEETFLSEFVYYLKRLGAFTSEDIIEFVKEQDSKVTRLLQLNNEIPYSKPVKVAPKRIVKELDVPDFAPSEVIAEEPEEIVLETDSIPDAHFTVEDAIEYATTPEQVCEVEEVVFEQQEEPEIEEETTVEESEPVAEEIIHEDFVVQEEVESQVQPRLSFLDLFSEDSYDDDIQEDHYYEVELDATRANAEESQEELIETMIQEELGQQEEQVVEEVIEEIEEESVEEEIQEELPEIEEAEETTQEMRFEQDVVEEMVAPVEESQSKKATITRLATDEKALVDLEEYVIGKSNFVNGMVIKGNPGISRKHAMIRWDAGHYFIRDLDSVNGTYVNDVFVEPETEMEILSGDSIKLGDEELIFTIE